MNYIRQILAFRLRRKLYPISSTSIALYYVLLEQFNQVRFPISMPISTGYLASELHVSTTTIRNCRRELRELRYIDMTISRRGCEYQMIDLTIEAIKDRNETHADI